MPRIGDTMWIVQYLEDGKWRDYCDPQSEEKWALKFYHDIKFKYPGVRILECSVVRLHQA